MSFSFASLVFIALTLFAITGFSQSTAFTYQGSILDNSVPPNGTYQMRFRLFDALSGGAQVGPTVENAAVPVENGIFTAELEFCGSSFPGADRFLQIEVRRNSGEAYVLLAPRQRLARVPFSTHSVSATTASVASNSISLGGVAANQYVLTGDPRLSDARNPLPGSTSYIQNTATQQASSNFNISGNGTAAGTLSGGIVNATTQFDLGGQRIFSAPDENIFIGVGTGTANTGFRNTFVGRNAGFSNTTAQRNTFVGSLTGKLTTSGSSNTFVGSEAGENNVTGTGNAFFGSNAGRSNTDGNSNVFIGNAAGRSNTTGSANTIVGDTAGFENVSANFNSFFGNQAGRNTTGDSNSFFGAATGDGNTTGFRNSFFGDNVGRGNTTGNNNSFFGHAAGQANVSGSNNTLIGTSANVAAPDLTSATAIGARAVVAQSDSVVLGSVQGVNGSAVSARVGIGTTTPSERLHVVGNGLFTGNLTVSGALNAELPAGSSSYIQNTPTQQASSNFNISGNGIVGGNLGIGTAAPSSRLQILDSDNTISPDIAQFFAQNQTQGVGIGFNRIEAVGSNTNQDLFIVPKGNGEVQVSGLFRVTTLGAAGSTQLCRNASNQIATCSSSLRYKKNVFRFAPGMSFVRQLRPISYEWKEGGMKDVGFGAEDVARIDPRFVTYNDKGEVEGIKYDRLSVAFVNAFTEQQAELELVHKEAERQRSQLSEQERRLAAQEAAINELMALLCAAAPTATICAK